MYQATGSKDNSDDEIKQETDFYRRFEPIPLDRSFPKIKLLHILSLKKIFKLFHLHKWVRWKYGEANRIHRVCEKCYKKEKRENSKWIEDSVI